MWTKVNYILIVNVIEWFAKLHRVLSQKIDFSPKENSSRLLRMFLSSIQAKNTKFVALVSICLLFSLPCSGGLGQSLYGVVYSFYNPKIKENQ